MRIPERSRGRYTFPRYTEDPADLPLSVHTSYRDPYTPNRSREGETDSPDARAPTCPPTWHLLLSPPANFTRDSTLFRERYLKSVIERRAEQATRASHEKDFHRDPSIFVIVAAGTGCCLAIAEGVFLEASKDDRSSGSKKIKKRKGARIPFLVRTAAQLVPSLLPGYARRFRALVPTN